MVSAIPMSLPASPDDQDHDSGGGRLVSTDGRVLPLTRAHVTAQASGGIARVTLEQCFRNPHSEPLVVTYLLPLPADGAVSGFSFTLGKTRIVGEVDRRASARERFERALVQGKTAALLDQERSSLFTQKVGNIPPGQEIVCEVVIDQRLEWLPEGAWQWRFPTVVGPRYMGAKGRVKDAQAISVAISDRPLGVGMTLGLSIQDTLARLPESPSHALDVAEQGRTHQVTFRSDASVRLDRDIVIRWPVATPEVGLSLDLTRPSSQAHQGNMYGLLTIVPPRPDSGPEPLPRDLIFLIDTSGSMGGQPLDQAKRVVCAMIDTLTDRDRLELIEFGSYPRRWRDEPVAATRDGRREAQKWVRKLDSSGATEMHRAVLEALAPLRPECQRQVVLITDGFIGFESEIVAAILKHLPRNCRLHTIGVGSAPNRSLTRPAARAGAGVELVIGLDEDAERVARRLLARTTAPLVTDLEISGRAVLGTAPLRLPDLFAGSPALVSLLVTPEGGPISVRGTMAGRVFEETIQAGSLVLGEGNQAMAALYGRERVEDLEMRCAVPGNTRDLDAEIERTGLEFQISTRLTSWIAVTEEVTVDPRGRRIDETMPHELPHGMQIEGLGLRASMPAAPTGAPALARNLAYALPHPAAPMPSGGMSKPSVHTIMGLPAVMPPGKTAASIGAKEDSPDNVMAPAEKKQSSAPSFMDFGTSDAEEPTLSMDLDAPDAESVGSPARSIDDDVLISAEGALSMADSKVAVAKDMPSRLMMLAAPPQPSPASSQVAEQAAPGTRVRRRLLSPVTLLVALIIAAIILGLWFWLGRGDTSASGIESPAAPVRPGAGTTHK